MKHRRFQFDTGRLHHFYGSTMDKEFLGKIVKIGVLIGMLYGAGVTTGYIWVTQIEFAQAVAEIQKDVDANTRQRYRERFYELADIHINPAMQITKEQREELCDLAYILMYSHELCRN